MISMPRGEEQEGKKRGPYKKKKEDVEVRLHKNPKERPPRHDVRKMIVPEEDPDLDENKYQKKPKKKKEEKEKESRILRIVQTFLEKQHT